MTGLVEVRLRAAGAIAALAAAGACAQPVSPAEVLLFETDHLAELRAPATLVYDFRGHGDAPFTDTVRLDLAQRGGGTRATVRFLSGERRYELPQLDDARGNPVLLGFLERDIAQMGRLTGGSATYFRKRIRMALAAGAQVVAQPIAWHGKQVPARLVRIQPYRDDPLHARLERYAGKTYRFVLSDSVPGGVYQLGTALADGAPDDETLTLVDALAQPR
ncbi:hypothetical protein ACFFTM_04175 [Pseudoduganella plicata]|uniref:Uncharacterized protein n=1 Tax=Pseudoduganella plicata TaxID=321984 RepID=A0A4P7BK81_9BURK|nr:hypothetical protein [Pseudoduganella plicata]QBQ38860.1 hypothetical protein E1742_23885 [Pseudoduganella plicata]GGZ09672.1 hypothetical protein GCM10007388_49060 [Pseudoduganella plicata]